MQDLHATFRLEQIINLYSVTYYKLAMDIGSTLLIDDEICSILKHGSLIISDTSKSPFSILLGYIYVIRQGNTLYCRYLEEYSDISFYIQ